MVPSCLVHLVICWFSCQLCEDAHATDEEGSDLVDLHRTQVRQLRAAISTRLTSWVHAMVRTHHEFVVIELGETFATLRLSCLADIFEKRAYPLWVLEVIWRSVDIW